MIAVTFILGIKDSKPFNITGEANWGSQVGKPMGYAK